MNSSRCVTPLLFIAVALFAGCSKDHSSADGHDHGAHSAGDGHDHGQPAASQHGQAGALPGSYEDWCAEHELPESKCTRCDTSLAAAFKATGDWCPEHGLPESHCVKCDPSRKMVRPPKADGK